MCSFFLKVHSFLITNLAIGDFFMGVYLMIIAVVDSYYRGVYIIFDRAWRSSDLCQFSGFISTFSSELSVLTLTVITLDRLICIIFPLRVSACHYVEPPHGSNGLVLRYIFPLRVSACQVVNFNLNVFMFEVHRTMRG
jgi:hypothetical protein